MGKVVFKNNYKAIYDSNEYEFYAQSERQAWYLAYEWSDGEIIDHLYLIDDCGNILDELTRRWSK